MTVSTLGTLNGRLTPLSDTLSSANPSDDFNLTLRTAGSLDLNFSGLSASTSVVLKHAGSLDKTAQVGSSGDVVFTGLEKGVYTVHVELPPNSNPADSGSGGTGGTGGSAGSGSTGGSGTGTGTPGTVQHQIVRLDYAGSVTSLSPLESYQIQNGTGYAPTGLGLGSSFSGSVDFDLYQSSVVTSFTFNGQSLGADPANPGGLGELTAGAATAHGWSSDPSIGLVTLNTFLLNYSSPLTTPGIKVTGGLNTQPLAPGLAYTIGGNTPYRSASSDNVVFTTVGVISGSGSNSGSGGTGGSTSTGSSGTGTGSTVITGSTSNNSTTFTLTVTADYAGNDLSAADQEITSTPTFTKDSPAHLNTTSTGVLKDWIDSSDKDYYSFKVNAPLDNTYSGTNVSVKLKGLAANVTVQFLDSTGKELAKTTVTGTEGSLQHIFSSGTYYVNVLTAGSGTNYTLDFAEIPLTTNLTYTTTGTQPFLTNLWEFDANGKASTVGIDPTKSTVVLIHGWNKSGSPEYTSKDSLSALAQTILGQNSNEQVLALDWGVAATDSGGLLSLPLTAAGRVKGVAQWAVNELKALGFNFSQLTLIGHSLGTYVADEIGVLDGQVGNLYALDPAGDPLSLEPLLSYNLDRANGGRVTIPAFTSAALHSYAFYADYNPVTGGIADSRLQAQTANFAFGITYTGDAENNLVPPQNLNSLKLNLDRIANRSTLYHLAGINVFTDLLNKKLVNRNLTLGSSALKNTKGSFSIKRPDPSTTEDQLTYTIV